MTIRTLCFYHPLVGLWPVWVLLGSCRMHQRLQEQQLHQYSLQQEQQHSDSVHNSLQRLYLAEDSSAIETLLLPLGPFHYSIQDGYTGKAGGIRIRQKQHHRQLQWDSISRHRLGKSSAANSMWQQEQYRQRQQVPAYAPVWLILPWVLLLVALLALYRFLKFRRLY